MRIQRNVFIDVGSLPRAKAEMYLQEVMDTMKHPQFETNVFPTREGPSRVEYFVPPKEFLC